MDLTRIRRVGVRLDVDRLDYELARRGITQARLAAESGVHAVSISRARHGKPVNEKTLERLTTALLRIPLMVGADLLVAEPEKKRAVDGSTSSTVKQEVSPDDRPAA